MTGVATNVSVESTARDGVQHDYNVVLVEDCTASYYEGAHEATLFNVRTSFGTVASSGEVLQIWKDYQA